MSYFWTPEKYILYFSVGTYLLITTAIGTLIVSTGGSASPFIALWMLVGIFASIFGIWGSLPILIATSVFVAGQYIDHNLTNEVVIIIAISSMLPIIASSIIWHSRLYDNDNSNSQAYKNLASELTEVASKSEVVINAIADGVIAIDYKGIIQLINPAAQNIIGWGKQDALALNYKSVLQLENQKSEPVIGAADPIQEVLNTNQQIRTDNLMLVTKNGKKMIVSLVVSPVGDLGSGVIAVFRDITKEKADEREQAEFISTASHEMRTPVASIEGYLGLALNPQTAQIDSRAHEFIMKAHQAAGHLGRLFQDLLDASKADDGRLSNNPKVVDITKFARDIVLGLEQKAQQKGINLIYKPIPKGTKELHLAPVYFVNLDNDHVREIISNLVENAIKYTPQGQVVVDISGDDDHITLSVKDTGIGIPAEDMPHLFQKFYRVENKDTREIGGTGLGLYICRRLAEIMGGRVWAESSRGNGSTFYVELPRISAQDADRLIEQSASPMATYDYRMTSQTSTAARPVINMASSLPGVAQPTIIPTQTTNQLGSTTSQTQQLTTVNTVPRGEALTPEQIAQYVSRQRALAKQNQPRPDSQPLASQAVTRTQQSIAVPIRESRNSG